MDQTSFYALGHDEAIRRYNLKQASTPADYALSAVVNGGLAAYRAPEGRRGLHAGVGATLGALGEAAGGALARRFGAPEIVGKLVGGTANALGTHPLAEKLHEKFHKHPKEKSK